MQNGLTAVATATTPTPVYIMGQCGHADECPYFRHRSKDQPSNHRHRVCRTPCAQPGGRSLGKIPGEAHADTAGHFITAFNWGSERTVSGTMQLSDNL